LPQFSGEKRLQPAQDAKKKKKDGPGAPVLAHGAAGGADSFGVYAPVPGDEIDALLGARLWRSHVEHFVEEQEDVGLVHEMGVPLASEVDVRPIICGNLVDPKAADREAIHAPHRQHRTLLRRPGARSPLEMIERELLTEVKILRPETCQSLGGGGGATRPGALPPVASARGSSKRITIDTGPTTQRALPPPASEADGGHGETTQKRAAVPSDFQRLAKGIYRFRDRDLIEIRLVDGDPLVFEHGPDERRSSENRRESFGETDDDDDEDDDVRGLTPLQIRRKLQLGANTHLRGVPLDTFICRTAA